MRALQIILKITFPILIIAGAFFAMQGLIASFQAPPRVESEEAEIPVEVITASQVHYQVLIEGDGTVQPAEKIILQPQVSGLVIEQSPKLIPGGIFKKGDLILKIDPRDYEYTVEMQKERVEQARTKLEEEKSRQTIAEREWNLIGKDVQTTESGKQLALRIPQIRSAQAAYDAAVSSLNDAKLDLERTEIRAPFNCWIQMEEVDSGQLVTPQTRLATLVGTDKNWIQSSIQAGDLPFISIPDINPLEGSKARVIHDAGRFSIEKEGEIIQLLYDMSEAGRMVRVLVEVEDPLGLKEENKTYPLLVDTYVNVEIEGIVMKDVFCIPWTALREGNRIWVRDPEGRLQIEEVDVLLRQRDFVVVREGIENGTQVVTSRLATPIPGTKLKLMSTESPQVVQKENTTLQPQNQADVQ